MATLPTGPQDQPSIGDLLRRLVEDTQHLFRTEIRLAKSEFRSNIAAAARGAVGIAVGGVLLLGAIFTLLGAAVAFLSPLVGAGFAGLIVAGAAALIGGILVALGARKLSASSFAPDKTVASLRHDAAALKGN